MTDPLADMLTRIRNALLRNKTSVLTPASKLRENVLLVLQDEGYIRGYTSHEYIPRPAKLVIHSLLALRQE